MNAPNAPQSAAAMYDLLQKWFGIGDHDEQLHDRPWHHARMVEIAKLKRMLTSRRATLTEVYIAAQYARDNSKPIHATWQVFALIPEAMRERFRLSAEERKAAVREELAQVIQEATDVGETEWAERLMRADDPAKAIAEWRAR